MSISVTRSTAIMSWDRVVKIVARRADFDHHGVAESLAGKDGFLHRPCELALWRADAARVENILC
jgi:hypothetical protein